MRAFLFSTAFLLTAIGGLHSSLAEQGKTIRCKLADGFDFPVGKPDAKNYYKARGFWKHAHVGEDWNGTSGGNTDLGDPIYAMGNGVVTFSRDCGGGWGNVVIIRHAFRDLDGEIRMVDSQYAHLQKRMVQTYQVVSRGQQIGTMGRGAKQPNGRYLYLSHLHFEIRKNLQMGMHRSRYKWDFSNFYSPTHFIRDRRQLRTGLTTRYSIPVDTYKPYTSKSSNGSKPSIASSSELDSRVVVPFLRDYRVEQGNSGEARPPSGADRIILNSKSPPPNPEFWKNLRAKLQQPSDSEPKDDCSL